MDSHRRFGVVFAGLACSVYQYAVSNGYANILISGLASGQNTRPTFKPIRLQHFPRLARPGRRPNLMESLDRTFYP